MPSFYEDLSFLNIIYAMDISIESHFTNLVLRNDSKKVVYASNSYAMRRRAKLQSDNGEHNLDLPFINYKLTNIDFSQQTWWNNRLFSRGIMIDELGKKIRCSPISLNYEATFWCHRADEVRFAYTEFRFDADSKTTITSYIDVGGKEIPFVGQLGYTGLSFEPLYTEKDWLDKNKIHSVTFDFDIITFIMKSNSAVSIPEKILLEFNSLHGISDVETKEENIELLISHFDESVTEKI